MKNEVILSIIHPIFREISHAAESSGEREPNTWWEAGSVTKQSLENSVSSSMKTRKMN